MRIRLLISVAAILIVAALLPAARSTASRGNEYNDSLIRLHVIANSDSLADQRVKLLVRDELIAAMSPSFDGVSDISTARDRVDRALPAMEAAARRVLDENGCSSPVEVTRGRYLFPEKTYQVVREGKTEALTLPEGEYEAVRVVIGSGRGQNWWCVLFPPLCLAGSVEVHGTAEKPAQGGIPAAAADAFVPELSGSVLEPVPPACIDVRYRFKLAELYRSWFK